MMCVLYAPLESEGRKSRRYCSGVGTHGFAFRKMSDWAAEVAFVDTL